MLINTSSRRNIKRSQHPLIFKVSYPTNLHIISIFTKSQITILARRYKVTQSFRANRAARELVNTARARLLDGQLTQEEKSLSLMTIIHLPFEAGEWSRLGLNLTFI